MKHSGRINAAPQSRARLMASTSLTISLQGTRSRVHDPKTRKSSWRSTITARASNVEFDAEDLLQFPDRVRWYEARFCADDMPDWNVARLVSSHDIAPGLRHVVVECEISRERVPLRNAYKAVGQKASVRVNGGVEYNVTVSSAPYPMSLNREPLFKVRGDLFAHEIKVPREPISIKSDLHLLVSKADAPDLFNMSPDDSVEVGPFVGSGLDLKGTQLLAIYRYPTVVVFVEEAGIASLRALLTSTSDVANINANLRRDIRVYYKVPNSMSVCYKEEFESWAAAARPCNAIISPTTSSFQQAFDDDDTLTYDPDTTAAIILTGGNKELEAEAWAACREAEIHTVLSDCRDQDAPLHLSSSPKTFTRWVEEPQGAQQEQETAPEAAVPTKTSNNIVPGKPPIRKSKN
eukprot:CAMPEP_0202901106 /NCGR_PEP_ID=MMETSP1392-20130828/13313_1 /ASSEMBLY_ACC=CAM_ASM_000868 /TAXON_ID=225041 /ORGANISM="Chlamydomonas chlamydogama, Strain SAG 11-48b" /LENGTH=405 /DNA_ID=CAMNT_0049587607 /DNA_START=199 /DNA_END=1416 /DNA_ORIENTATION=+